MKLIQYRFLPDALDRASQVGRAVQALFESAHDTNLTAIWVEQGAEKLSSRLTSVSDVANILENAFIQSYANVVNYSDCVWIRSNTSCRFAIVEEGGLLRVCQAHADAEIEFPGLQYTLEDVSGLLITSDLFD